MSRVFAYCRVSTFDQTTENQAREIAAAGFKITPQRTIVETVSGSVGASIHRCLDLASPSLRLTVSVETLGLRQET